MDRKQLLDLYETTMYRINNDEERGVISEREANFNRANLYNEYTQALAELEGMANFSEDYEDEVEEVYPANELGDFLLQVGEANGYENYEEFVEDLAEELDVDPYALDELITAEGDPDADVTAFILDKFGLLDEEEDEYEEEEETENYNSYNDNAEFRLRELEAKVNLQELENKVTDALFQRESLARQMVEAEQLPPAIYELLFNAPEGSNVAAEFSAVCDSNGVDEATELYAIDKVLNIFSYIPFNEMGLFSDYIEDAAEFSANENYMDAVEDEQARRNVMYRLGL